MLGGEGLVTVPQNENLEEKKGWNESVRLEQPGQGPRRTCDSSSHNQSCHTVSFRFELQRAAERDPQARRVHGASSTSCAPRADDTI